MVIGWRGFSPKSQKRWWRTPSLTVACEHFIYGLFPDGYKLLKSKGVNQLLSSQSLYMLRQLRESKKLWWDSERVVTVSHVESAQDQFERDGVWNHTVVVPIITYLQIIHPSELSTSYRLPNTALRLTEYPRPLPPLEVT